PNGAVDVVGIGHRLVVDGDQARLERHPSDVAGPVGCADRRHVQVRPDEEAWNWPVEPQEGVERTDQRDGDRRGRRDRELPAEVREQSSTRRYSHGRGPASCPDPSPTYQVAKRNFASKSNAPALATPENAGTLGRAWDRRAASPLPE